MTLSSEEKKELLEELNKRLMEPKIIHVEICRPGVKLPKYSNLGDAGMDIRAAEDIIIKPGETVIVPTGLKMAIPAGFELQVRPRSGMSLKTPLRIANSPGTIDSGYRDEIGIIVNNQSDKNYQFTTYKDQWEVTQVKPNEIEYPVYGTDEKGNKSGTYQIKKGDRIAQIVLTSFQTINFVESDNVMAIGTNRGGGFGSTGTE